MKARVLSLLVLCCLWMCLAPLALGCTGTDNLQNGLASCTTDANCPSGYHCASDQTCWANGANPISDASVPETSGDGFAGCPAGQIECEGTCVDPRSNGQYCGATSGCGVGGKGSAGTACTGGLVCSAGKCSVSCPGTQVDCAGTCVDPTSDPAHCGATAGCGTGGSGSTGTACASGEVCTKGSCQASCASTETDCNGACVDTTTDPSHCGSCTNGCALAHAAVDACVKSACAVASCDAGYADCDGIASNGCETAVDATDVNNCGGCGIKCAYANASATCAAGVCALGACNTGYADCDGSAANGCEIDTQGDVSNCGMCGDACASGQVCSTGKCGATCGAGLANCAGSCVDETTDVNHCGGCANVCMLQDVSVNACSASTCVVGACAAGYGDCDEIASNGCETQTSGSDVNNCGGCGIQCAYANAGATCNAGACAIGACNTGFADCDGKASDGCEVNTQSDSQNCGGCGMPCPGGQVCSSGACATTCGGTLADCSGSCVNESTDVDNCGACSKVCALPNVSVDACSASSCAVVACAMGYANCDGIASNGCETAILSTDANNCGGCGIQCNFANAAATCATGTCVAGACNMGFANCNGNPADGCEVDTQSDNGNCGGCGTVCPSGQVCSSGKCTTTCGGTLTNCSGSCVNESTDVDHCGSCTNACALPNVSVDACSASACVIGSCAAGYGNCDGNTANGCETAVKSNDVGNCGGCGIACSYPNAGASCSNGTCAVGACNLGFANCDGTPSDGCEVDTQSDNDNCGGCGTVCPGGQVCSAGMCTTSCGAQLTNCSGSCVNEATDVNHCGSCTNVCSLPNVSVDACSASACVIGACATGYGNCDGITSNGCEKAILSNDVGNCGGCGIACGFPNAAATCSTGTCGMGACNAGYANCDGNAANGCEVDTQSDNGNCGGCGDACPNGQVCSAGKCQTTCGAGLTNCSGSCVNESNDPNHCGGCATVCGPYANATPVCVGSGCHELCTAPYIDCSGTGAGGCKVDPLTDSNNCGLCGHVCTAGTTCNGGSCCDANCVSCSGPGQCLACAAGYIGSGGVCIPAPTGGTITTIPGYRIHTFTSSGTFQFSGNLAIDYLIVAGGGGGGSGDGAGGGGGGVLQATSVPLSGGAYAIVVGAGGAGASSVGTGDPANPPAQNGSNSSFNGLVAIGGGSGGSEDNTGGGGPLNFGADGGCGGGFGGANGPDNEPGGNGTAGQGNNGGTRYPALTPKYYGMGGGGGAGAAGGNGDTSNTGGAGGAGIASSITGTSVYYAGGGGGSSRNRSPCTPGPGGLGGGGAGGYPTYFSCGYSNGVAGTANTGGGGGGGGDQRTTGGAGGSGIVIIRYPYSPPLTPVNLTASFTTEGAIVDGQPSGTPGGGIDGAHAFSATKLNVASAWTSGTIGLANGVQFAMQLPTTTDLPNSMICSGQTVALPEGNFSTLAFIAADAGTSSAGQTNLGFVVTYTDGSTTTLTQSVSDALTNSHYAGETLASTTSDLDNNGDGSVDNQGSGAFLYEYSIALNSSKTVQSIMLPNTGTVGGVSLFAITLLE